LGRAVAFVCVENAGRSQMAAAFAEEMIDRRGLDLWVISGGTDPAEAVHPVVAEAMRERGIDISGREPRRATREELAEADVVVTMGCTGGVCPAGFVGEHRDWDLEDPGGKGTRRRCGRYGTRWSGGSRLWWRSWVHSSRAIERC